MKAPRCLAATVVLLLRHHGAGCVQRPRRDGGSRRNRGDLRSRAARRSGALAGRAGRRAHPGRRRPTHPGTSNSPVAPAPGHGEVDSAWVTDDDGRASVFWKLGSRSGFPDPADLRGRGHRHRLGGVARPRSRAGHSLRPPIAGRNRQDQRRLGRPRLFGRGRQGRTLRGRCRWRDLPPICESFRMWLAGARHYGAIVVPPGASDESLHVATYLHGATEAFRWRTSSSSEPRWVNCATASCTWFRPSAASR